MSNFQKPKFGDRHLEIRTGPEGVSIYGSKQGIERLAEMCAKLAKDLPEGSSDHIHLEDFELLTGGSVPLVVACFNEETSQLKKSNE